MTNEAEIVELLGNQGEVIDFTVADATGISKGSLMSGADLRTAVKSASGGENQQTFVGIAAADKEANDGAVNLGLYTKGIFDLIVVENGSVTMGDMVTLSGANTIASISGFIGNLSAGYIVGKALETGTSAERIEVAVGVYQ